MISHLKKSKPRLKKTQLDDLTSTFICPLCEIFYGKSDMRRIIEFGFVEKDINTFYKKSIF